MFCAVFSGDGRRLAATTSDGQVLIWVLAVPAAQAAALTPQGLQALWTDLASNDAPRGFKAIFTLAAAPQLAVPFLKKRLRPVTSSPDQAGRWSRWGNWPSPR